MSTALFAVTVGQRVDKREDLKAIIDGTLSRPDDTVPISPLCCPGPQPGQYTFSVPLETAEVRPDALSIPRAGLYPITIEVQRGGRIISTVITFINRLAAPDEASSDDALSVAFAIGTHSEVHLDSKGVTSLDSPSTVTEMTALANTLDALDASSVRATIRIEPAVLNGLQQLDSALFARLVAALQRHQVVAETQWPLDASEAAAANQDALYTSWLRDGQDQLSDLGLGPSVMTRSTIFADTPVSPDGATLRRDLGAALMVMTPKLYDSLDGTIFFFSDNTGQLIEAQLPNSTSRHGGDRSRDLRAPGHAAGDARADPDLCRCRSARLATGHRDRRGRRRSPLGGDRYARSRRARRLTARLDHRARSPRRQDCDQRPSTTYRCAPTAC